MYPFRVILRLLFVDALRATTAFVSPQLVLGHCRSARIGRTCARIDGYGDCDEDAEIVYIDAEVAESLQDVLEPATQGLWTRQLEGTEVLATRSICTQTDQEDDDEIAAGVELDALAAEMFAGEENYIAATSGSEEATAPISSGFDEDVQRPMLGISVGIDLGTTNSAVAAMVDGEPTILRRPIKSTGIDCAPLLTHIDGRTEFISTKDGRKGLGPKTIPSAVAFGPGVGEVAVGKAAFLKTGHRIDREEVDKDRTLCDEEPLGAAGSSYWLFTSVKRVIGRTIKEAREAGEDFGVLNMASQSVRSQYYQKRRQELHQAMQAIKAGMLQPCNSSGGCEDLNTVELSLAALQKSKASGMVLLQLGNCEAAGHDVAAHKQMAVAPEVISAEVVRHLLETAELALGVDSSAQIKRCTKSSSVTRAVITVPAYFNAAQCSATREAGKLAGLEKVALLKEPEAAALAYGLGKDNDELVLVFDLGGGTLDVSVLEVGGGVIEVIATSGDNHLGGDDFDVALADYLGVELLKAGFMGRGGGGTNVVMGGKSITIVAASSSKRSPPLNSAHFDPRQALSPDARRHLRRIAENAKKRLSQHTSVDVIMDPVALGVAHLFDGFRPTLETEDKLRVCVRVSRRTFAAQCEPLMRRVMTPLREVALMAGVLLPGDVGAAAAPFVGQAAAVDSLQPPLQPMSSDYDSQSADQERVDITLLKKRQQKARARARNRQKRSKRERAETILAQKGFDEVQSRGSRKDMGTMRGDGGGSNGGALKMRPFPLGRVVDNIILVGGATRMPAIRTLLRVTFGVEPRRTVNPDEAVALGAALHAGMMDGDRALESLDVLSPFQASVLRYLHRKKEEKTSL
jgi:molecular chaperone DnaK (HSP70)